MRLAKALAPVCAAAFAAVVFSAGGAMADDGSLISMPISPTIGALCFATNQVGNGNALQNITCTQSSTNPTPPANGGVTGQEVIFGPQLALEPGQQGASQAVCPPGKVLTGGGYLIDDVPPFYSAPSAFDPTTTWQAVVSNTTNKTQHVQARAVCVNAG